MICQIAASLALLTAAVEMAGTFREKWRDGPGFRTDHLLTMAFDPQLAHTNEAQTERFYKELIRRVRVLPGVKSAALTGELPMSNDTDDVSISPEGFRMPPGRETFPVDMNVAGDGYFDTLGVQLIRGRGFRQTDTATAPKVAVVNEEFAQKYWPNTDALGKRFRLDNAQGPAVQIVGITKTAKYEWIGEPPTQFVYLPWTQHPRSKMTLLVESQGPPTQLIEPVRNVVRSIDAGQPVFGVRTAEDFYQKRIVRAPVMILQTVSAMGLAGLALTLAGLYGLMTYATGRRTREIGIRMAVGADTKDVLGMVLRQALRLVAVGVGIGLVLAAAAEKGLQAIFESTRIDFAAYLLILPALVAVTMLAAFIPARKASRIEPSRALRYE
ncbi:MAG: ABC transporter permease [Acidobacteriaceae bacterium]|nr:ABC transporter permease [Acidobacteriaceae bacterium]